VDARHKAGHDALLSAHGPAAFC